MAKEIILGIRAEDIHDAEAEGLLEAENVLDLKIDVAELLGSDSQVTVKLPGLDAAGQSVTSKITARDDIHMGDQIKLQFEMSKCHFFDAVTEKRIVEGGPKYQAPETPLDTPAE